SLSWPRGPVDSRVDTKDSSGVAKLEDVRHIRARALQIEVSEDLIPRIDRLVQSRLQTVLMGHVDERNLIVVPGIAVEIGRGKQIQRCLGLSSDALRRDEIAVERPPGEWIDNLNRLTERILRL